MSFKLQAKKYLLTYPQCNEDKAQLLEFLKSKGQLEEYVVAKERHEDGNYHLHAYVAYKQKLCTRDQRYFDFGGYHCNIVAIRNRMKTIEYCCKEDPTPLSLVNQEEKLGWGEILETSTNEKEFLAKVLENFPREYALNLEKLEYCARKHFTPQQVEYTPRYTNFINVPIELLTLDLIQVGDRPKSIIILGPRGLGKTEWARSHGPHLYSRGAVIYDDIIRDREGSKYAVFDDLWEWNFRFLKDFLGGQPTATITGKYRKPKLLDWGIRSIFLTNEKFWEEWTPKQREYFFDSTILIELSNKLY